MSSLGKLVKELRTKKKLSQDELADMLEVHRSYISKIENETAEYAPSVDVVEDLARIFGVDEYELMIFADKVPKRVIEVLKSDEEARRYMKEKIAALPPYIEEDENA